jgi:hypothetical protein
MADETVWLSQAQMVKLFQSSKANISEHIKHVYDEGELEEGATARKFRTVRIEDDREVEREVTYYNIAPRARWRYSYYSYLSEGGASCRQH